MLNSARNLNSLINFVHSKSNINQLFYRSRQITKNVVTNKSFTSLNCYCRPNLVQKVKSTPFIRYGAITGVLYKSTQNNKARKSVGYWLLTCSGMVFVAVVLEEIIKSAIR
ncbi:hypothetical protein HHI36_012141 [Cryptolaemus montrouzieri]|uniref:Uncharacterized protein n=1 Tax=Cryptolaemus montrouzieri TaxID=559131 RepID=A0ABD2NE12_9CUCU